VSPEDRLDRLEQRVAVLETLMRELAGKAPATSPAAVSPPLPPPPLQPLRCHRQQPQLFQDPLRPAPPSTEESAHLRAVDRAAWTARRRRRGPDYGDGVPAQASFDRELDHAGHALRRWGRRWCHRGRDRLAAARPLPHLRRRPDRVWGRDYLPEASGQQPGSTGVVPSFIGIVGLALVSIALAMIAYAINVEALGATAALGAFLAPVLLGHDRSNANLLLLYLASMAAGLGLVAARRGWRLAMLVVAASYFGVGTAGAADRAVPWACCSSE